MNSLLITTYRQFASNKCNGNSKYLFNQINRSFSRNDTPRLAISKYKTPSKSLIGCSYPASYASSALLNTSFIRYPTEDFNQHQSIRRFSYTSPLFEQASSKVEETVKNLQEKEKEREKEKEKDAAKQTQLSPAGAGVPAEQPKPPKTLKQKIWDEIVHYYHGFRLLFIDMNVARKLLWKVLRGNSLTRREYRLLIRTTGDVFRLVPFSVFIIVPFMEFLLPVFIKFFPGMLPSTFETAKDKEVKARNNLKVKLEMAKFLQKTLDEMDVQHKDHSSEEAKEFLNFFNKLRTTGEPPTSEEILKFSKLFEDEITLDSLSRQQLTAICKVLEVGSLGTSNFLRFQLRMKLRSLAADDRMIQREGVDSLMLSELQSACRSRGMRAYGVSEEKLKTQLAEWINLSLNERVPPSLLLLSRAMMLPEDVTTAEKLKASISSLSETAAIQTQAAIGEREGKIDNRTQIEIIRDEERKIKEELEELKEVEEERKKETKQIDELVDKAKVITDDITHKDIEVVCDALSAVSEEKKRLILEKEEIKELKEEIAEYKEDVEELQQLHKQSDTKLNVRESPAAKRLLRKVDAMIGKLDKVVEGLEKKEKKLQELGDTPEELIRIDEVVSALRKMQKVADESKVEKIFALLGKIDDDKDGQLKVDDVLKIIETIGKENVNLSVKQLDEIIELITKEEYLENEEKIEKALARSIEARQQKQQMEDQQQKDEQQKVPVPDAVDRPQPQFADGQLSEINILPNVEDEKHILKSDKPVTKKNEESLDDRIAEIKADKDPKTPAEKTSTR